VGEVFYQMLRGDVSNRSSVLLCMGLDKGDGVLTLKDGSLNLDWPQETSMPLYQAILDCGEKFKNFVRSRLFMPLPTWNWPLRNNITVHALGGCILADRPEEGVVSADERTRGQAFGYQGLYIADGSVLPSAVGANPVATISAVSEWIAQGITGNPDLPTDDLSQTIP
jgi:cholesterol oxidase